MLNMYPTVIIGIGGSGKLTCKFLKKNFADRFPKNWLSPATGLPPIVEILVIETEPGKEKEELRLIGLPDVPTIAAYVNESTLKAMQKTKEPDIKRWLSPPLPIKEIIGGAGQIRQAGRLAFFRHRTAFGKIQQEITGAIDNVKSDEAINQAIQFSQGEINIPDRTPRCYIISSVCGGTGSGMLLDIAGVVGNSKAHANLIALLPKMFEAVVDLPESVWQLYSNSYATLKEINHYMTSGKWQVWYNEKKRDGVELDKKIFEYSFLVEKESDSVDLKDRLHVSPLIGEFLFWLITELQHPLHAAGINIQRFIAAETSKWCNGLGISSISFPLEQIREIMINWGIRGIITDHLSENFSHDEIKDRILNPNTGYLFSDFHYKNWEPVLLEKNQYTTLSPETLSRRKGKLENKIKDEKNRLKREQEDDFRRIKEGFEKYVEKVKDRFIKLAADILTSKGPAYFSAFIDKFGNELDNVKKSLEDEQQKANVSISELGETTDRNIKLLANIGKKKWFMDIGWAKRIEPHLISVLNTMKDLFAQSLKVEKHTYALKIIDELKKLIDKEQKEISSLSQKLDSIRISKKDDENRLWSTLTFASDAQIKVKSDLKDVQEFYERYVKNSLRNLGVNLRTGLLQWEGFTEKKISEEISVVINQRISQSGFDNMTILDAMKDQMQELGNKVQDCLVNKSLPLIKHSGAPVEDRFFISGLDEHEIRQLPPFPANVTIIKSDTEKTKRRMIFVQLSANFSIEDLAEFDFSDKYAKAYEDSLNKNHKWVHILPEALGFEDPLGLSIGMEEESLIRTCQDVGIVIQQRGYYFEYKEGDKKVVLDQGLGNTIRKLQEDPKTASYLKKKLLDFFNNQTKEWLHQYLKDHIEEEFPDEEKFRKSHESKYKNEVSNFAYSIPVHKVPTYVLRELKKRL